MNLASAQLRGHGGPVRTLPISPDGQTAISGSFDSTAIRWSLARGAAEQVLRFHADAVRPQKTSFAIVTVSRAPSLHADCAPWASATSLLHQPRRGRMVIEEKRFC